MDPSQINGGQTTTTVVTDPPADASAQANSATTQATDPVKVDPVKTETTPAERYAISQERERRKAAEARIKELETEKQTQKPIFDDKYDPDGSKEIEWKIQEGIKQGLRDAVKDLGLEDTLNTLKQKEQMDSFFEKVNTATPKFEAMGIKATREELTATLKTLDEHGITPEQLIAITKMNELLGLVKPAGFTPGDGGKAGSGERVKTQEEINAEIYKANGAFGF